MSESPTGAKRRGPLAGALLSLSVSLCLLAACRAPAPLPLEPGGLSLSLDARANSPELVEQALVRAGLAPLLASVPGGGDRGDPESDAWWHARALAFAPAVRAARARLEAARARAGSAGAPGPIEVATEVEELSDPSAHGRVMATLDLLGLLGLGPSGAARELADAEVRAAHAELEQAAWRALHQVDEARARLAAVRVERSALIELRLEASADRPRIDVLDEHGRLSAAAQDASKLALRALDAGIAALAVEDASAAEALALAAGIPEVGGGPRRQDEEFLAALGSSAAAAAPLAEELLARLPQLRRALLEYAVAEARLGAVAMARWPSLRLGPHLEWAEDDLLEGALAGAGIPWPGSLAGELEAARVEREAARERVEDELLAARVTRAAASARLAASRALLEQAALPARDESERVWRAARARFSVDPLALADWAEALRLRAEALAGAEEARAELALAALALREASGPEQRGPEVRP